MGKVDDDLSIRTLIEAVSRELLESQVQRQAAGRVALFEVECLTLEISFVATTSKHGSGGFDLKVVKADAGAQYDKQSIQKVILTLKAIADIADESGQRARVAPTGMRPR